MWPASENGTSDPSSAASSSRSSRLSPVRHSASQATSVAAASAEPPAMPPATGTPLCRCRWTPSSIPARSASRAAARSARFDPSVGTSSACGPLTVSVRCSDGVATTSSNTDTAWNTVDTAW